LRNENHWNGADAPCDDAAGEVGRSVEHGRQDREQIWHARNLQHPYFLSLFHKKRAPACHSERRRREGSAFGHSPNRTRLVSCSWPVGRVSDAYSSGRRARNQRLPDDVGSTDASRSATTMSSPNARDSAMTSP